ncbi:MAG: hypothetical protein GTN49_09820 [candidate division Zixibacteria bacterium]|nr:hypothetical protein [candidate division Zixibacteria bacterium]
MEKFAMFIKERGRILAPAVLGLAVICFALPFVDVSCAGTKVGTVSGFDLVTGSSVGEEEINPNWWVVAAFVCAALGVVFTIFRRRILSILTAVTSVVGVVCLLIFRGDVNSKLAAFTKEAAKESDIGGAVAGMFTVDYRYGYWLVFILLLIGAAVRLFWDFGKEYKPLKADTPEQGPG